MQLEIYRFSLTVIGELAGLARRIGRQDRGLSDQLRRAAQSVALNLAEGECAVGGNRRMRFDSSMNSAKESVACLEVAVAMGYLPQADIDASANGLGRIIATVTKLNRRG